MASAISVKSGPSAQPTAALAEPFEPASAQKGDKKNKIRGLFGIGKKKTVESAHSISRPDSTPTAASTAKLGKQTQSPASPSHADASFVPSSPSHGFSSSPRLASPAGSQIFERDVQESVLIPTSPAIPSHIITEDHVPPVLDASSEAITDEHLNPDSVEIITHANHQPAAVAVNVAAVSDNAPTSWQDDLSLSLASADFRPLGEQTDSASNYGSLDSSVDVRRLSFISFADVVQAEHQGHGGLAGSRESIHLAGLTSLSSIGGMDHRSPSPIRSPVSSTTGGAGSSPPHSKSASLKGVEMSPTRMPLGSPVSTNLSLSPLASPMGIHGDINVETMAQALRKTGSGDLSGVRSHATSPIDNAPSR
ncbi:hypothetical protein BD289DRAFT_67227 [Coniella lustricola]|uniref:Uncharacterized protein n=1 Tax=Coniella lustricola TaxID=2025994 RepID=A0A2T3AI01_9PEZI|nr:hypothetical protein BD289DRAFT_67227 [Coniella lustricola]